MVFSSQRASTIKRELRRVKKNNVEKNTLQDTLQRVVFIFLVSKFRIPKTLYLSDGEADNVQWYLKLKTYFSQIVIREIFVVML